MSKQPRWPMYPQYIIVYHNEHGLHIWLPGLLALRRQSSCVAGSVNYTVSFEVITFGVPNLLVARVTRPAGSKFYQVVLQQNYTLPVSVAANVQSVTLSFAGQGVRTIVALPIWM
jgi:hypothetical protein